MRKIADSKEFTVPATIDDPTILDEIAESLKTVGLAGAWTDAAGRPDPGDSDGAPALAARRGRPGSGAFPV